MEKSSSTVDADTQEEEQSPDAGQHVEKEDTKQPSRIKQLWAKTGLDMGSSLIIIKAGVPQTIAIAAFQARQWAEIYVTLGYLVAIASVLGFAIMPRAKFIQTMIMNIIAICIGASVSLLAIWSIVQARIHTTPAGSSPELFAYNSSASAVGAIWLFFQVYVVNSLKSARPQLQFPAILYSIFVNVAMTVAPQFQEMSTGIAFVKQLTEAFLTGFALATGVSLFFIPVTQRTVVFKQLTGYLSGLRRIMKLQIDYTSSLEHVDMFQGMHAKDDDNKSGPIKTIKAVKKHKKPAETAEAVALKKGIEGLRALHGTLAADLTFAKREMAYGKLRPSDLSKLFNSLRDVFLPLLGMGSLIEIFNRIAHKKGWDQHDHEPNETERKNVQEWQDIMKTLHQPLAEVGAAIDRGLEHVLLRLELIKPSKTPSKSIDEEAKGDAPRPGTDEFAAWLDLKTKKFYDSRKISLGLWCKQKGIVLPEDAFETGATWNPSAPKDKDPEAIQDLRQQLYMVLYIEHLLYTASRRTLDLVAFADSKVSDGTMKSSRLIAPGYRRINKWIKCIFSAEGVADTSSYVVSMDAQDVYLGQAFQDRKDPEHLPAQNAWEKIGNAIRIIPHLLKSEHSAFGFRVACATLSIGIVAYLRGTAVFFVAQRLVWAMIMVAISMTRTSGQSLYNFTLRVFGTMCAMIASYLIYYIPDGKTAGIIVFLYIWQIMCFYVVIKMPRYVVLGLISAVTAVLIIGQELQVRVLGIAVAESSGQPAYGINVLAPYRLATVAGGLAVAWVWTIFPYPVTEHSELRKDVGAAIYLLASFYAIVHETVRARVRGDDGDPREKTSPAARLDKARQKVFSKQLLLIGKLKTSSAFSKWEMALGGKFPRATYDILISCTESVMNYSALISYASRSFDFEDNPESKWQQDFRHLLREVATTSHDITSRLCLLSSSVSNGTPLPPYLKDLEPYNLMEKLRDIDTDILSVRHIAEPGYAAFAVIQVASRSVISDLNRLTFHVKELVGELDFSFQVVSSASSADPHEETSNAKGKQA